MILDETINAKDAWLKQVKHHKKRLKGLPRISFNPNAGNVEHNISMINKMLGSGEMLSNNPISGPFGGDVGASTNAGEGMSMGESLHENMIDELDPNLSKFLISNLDLIDSNDFSTLYDLITASITESELTEALILAGIDPLPYMSDIPNSYASKCNYIHEITIPGNIKRIGDFAFYDSSSLEGIDVEEGCIYIGEFAFEACPELTDVYLPSTIRTLDVKCFANCPSLAEIMFAGTIDQWKLINISRSAFNNSPVIGVKCADGVYEF